MSHYTYNNYTLIINTLIINNNIYNVIWYIIYKNNIIINTLIINNYTFMCHITHTILLIIPENNSQVTKFPWVYPYS